MTSGPDGVLFSREHLWVRVTDGTARVGLTDFGQENLGDVVAISLPGLSDGVTAGLACGDIESTKSVNDLVAPVSGVVTAINADLAERRELVNTDPYGDGWLIDVRLDLGDGTADLMSAADYAQLIGRSPRRATMHVHNRVATRSDITSAAMFAMTDAFLKGITLKVDDGEPWTRQRR